MKKYGILYAILALAFASLACQTVMGGGNDADNDQQPPAVDGIEAFPTAAPEASDVPADSGDSDFSLGGDSDFPMPDDAFNIVIVAGVSNFQTKLSLDEVLAFYRDTYGKLGYTERESVTTISDGIFSIVLDGDESGKAVVIQGVDLGDGSVNVNISLQDV